MNCTHETVNHSRWFIDPVTGGHTQRVERMWGGAKGTMRQQKTIKSEEFMWRKRFDTVNNNAFDNIIKHISEQYPGLNYIQFYHSLHLWTL